MHKIDRNIVSSTWAATSGEELHSVVTESIRLEFSTIPPYLTAMLSLAPGSNREIWNVIHSIVIDEMLHMAIGCNLLNALGGRPIVNTPGFLPTYPGPLPMGIGDTLVVGLEAYSPDLSERTFMKIEEPEEPVNIAAMAEGIPEYATIGEFYSVLIQRIQSLGDSIFIGDKARQLISPKWFGDRLVKIQNAESAVSALTILIQEGEGTPKSPVDPDGDFAHYYRFWELARGRRLVRDTSKPEGFSFSGAEIPFDRSKVLPLTPNQSLAMLDPESRAGRYARHFAFVFSKLMNSLQRCFDGQPERFDDAMGLMYELKLAGQRLVQIELNGTGFNVGPVFEFVDGL